MNRRVILSTATIVALFGLVMLGLAVGVRTPPETPSERLGRIARLMTSGDLESAREAAIEAFADRDRLNYDEFSVPSYWLGRIVEDRVAGTPPSAPRARALRLAARHLKNALAGPLPEELASDARHRLAWIEAEAGSPTEAAAALDAALAEGGETDDLPLLRAKVELDRPVPNFTLVDRWLAALAERLPAGSPARLTARSLLCEAAIRQRDAAAAETNITALAHEEPQFAAMKSSSPPDDGPTANIDESESRGSRLTEGTARLRAGLRESDRATDLAAFFRAAAYWIGVLPQTPTGTQAERLQEALTSLGSVEEGILSARRAGQAVLLRGLILADLEHDDEALAVLARLAASTPSDQLVAALRATEIRLRRDEPVPTETIEALVAALADPSSIGHPFLEASDLTRRLIAVWDGLINQQQFDLAIQLADGSAAAVGPEIQQRLRAVTYLREAESIDPSLFRNEPEGSPLPDVMASLALTPPLTIRPGTPGPTTAAQRASARERLQRAAEAITALAEIRFERAEYPTDLYAAGIVSLAAEDFPTAVTRFTTALPEAGTALRPQLLTARGEAYREVALLDEAERDFRTVIEEESAHPSAYAARNLLADLCSLQGRVAESLALLEDNLYRSSLTPRSAEWRTSLFLAGEIQFREAAHVWSRLQQEYWAMTDAQRANTDAAPLRDAADAHAAAVTSLSEAARRFPDDPRTGRAWYMVGEASRRKAVALAQERDRALVPQDRLRLNEERQRPLHEAITAYEAVETAFQSRTPTRVEHQTDGTDARTLRNSRFARASVLFDLGRFDEAMKLYSEIAAAEAESPLAIEALLRVARCLREMGQHDAAKTKIQQAALLFERLRDAATFPGLSRYPVDDWDRLFRLLTREPDR